MKNENPGEYKTEEQLKREAKARREAEAAVLAARPQSELKQKGENFWYHYKWHAIIGVAVLLLTVFLVRDILLRPKHDATVIVVTKSHFTAEDADMLAAALQEKTGAFVVLDRIILPAPDAVDYASAMKLAAVLSAGIDPIFLLDEAAYAHIIEMALNENDAPGTDNIFEPDSVPAADIDPGFANLKFYLRRHTGKNAEYHSRCRDILTAIESGD